MAKKKSRKQSVIGSLLICRVAVRDRKILINSFFYVLLSRKIYKSSVTYEPFVHP